MEEKKFNRNKWFFAASGIGRDMVYACGAGFNDYFVFWSAFMDTGSCVLCGILCWNYHIQEGIQPKA